MCAARSVQVTRLAAATAVPTMPAARSTRRLPKRQGAHQRIETLRKQLVDLGHHTAQFGTIKMPLHQADQILHQQITLHLHDGRRIGTNKKHHKVVTRFRTGLLVFFVELGVVESDFDRRPGMPPVR